MKHTDGVIGNIDREERKRLEELRRKAKESHVVVKSSDDPGRRKRYIRVKFTPGKYQLGWQAQTLGELVVRKAIHAATRDAYLEENPPIVHVKDGKPLTAHGAKLLGVPWIACCVPY